MKTNPLLTNQSLKSFIERAKIAQEHKDFLLEKLPEMDNESREELLKTLTKVYILELEEQGVVERLSKFQDSKFKNFKSEI